jgi:hypothetical protein
MSRKKETNKELDSLVHGGQKVIDSAIILLCCIFGSAISIIASIILTKI